MITQRIDENTPSIASIEPDGSCDLWPTKGREPERFTGPWNNTLANPMLIISALSDPYVAASPICRTTHYMRCSITPLASARLVNRLMPESTRLLIQDTPGHTSHGLAVSLCVAHALRAYYADGTLPENEKHCASDREIFETQEMQAMRVEGLTSSDRDLRGKLDHASSALLSARMGSMYTHSV